MLHPLALSQGQPAASCADSYDHVRLSRCSPRRRTGPFYRAGAFPFQWRFQEKPRQIQIVGRGHLDVVLLALDHADRKAPPSPEAGRRPTSRPRPSRTALRWASRRSTRRKAWGRLDEPQGAPVQGPPDKAVASNLLDRLLGRKGPPPRRRASGPPDTARSISSGRTRGRTTVVDHHHIAGIGAGLQAQSHRVLPSHPAGDHAPDLGESMSFHDPPAALPNGLLRHHEHDLMDRVTRLERLQGQGPEWVCPKAPETAWGRSPPMRTPAPGRWNHGRGGWLRCMEVAAVSAHQGPILALNTQVPGRKERGKKKKAFKRPLAPQTAFGRHHGLPIRPGPPFSSSSSSC